MIAELTFFQNLKTSVNLIETASKYKVKRMLQTLYSSFDLVNRAWNVCFHPITSTTRICLSMKPGDVTVLKA
jgi:hypothetical protein